MGNGGLPATDLVQTENLFNVPMKQLQKKGTKGRSERSDAGRPPFSIITLICMAISNNHKKDATL